MKGAFCVWVDAGSWVAVDGEFCVFGFAEMEGNLIEPRLKASPRKTVIIAINT